MGKRIDFSVWIVAIAAVAVVIGSALSWVSAEWAGGSIHVSGITGDGKVTILCAAAATIAVASASARRSTHVMCAAMTAIAGGMVAATALYDTVDLRHAVAASGRLTDGLLTAQVGVGLWIVDVASVVLLAGAVCALRESALRRTDLDFAPPLPRPSGDMVVSRTVVVVPVPREASSAGRPMVEALERSHYASKVGKSQPADGSQPPPKPRPGVSRL
jgi:hypothetical protein